MKRSVASIDLDDLHSLVVPNNLCMLGEPKEECFKECLFWASTVYWGEMLVYVKWKYEPDRSETWFGNAKESSLKIMTVESEL